MAVGLVAGSARPVSAAVTGMQVTAQSLLVPADGSFVVEIAIDGTPIDVESLELAVTVFDRVLEEADVANPPTRAANRLEPVPLNLLIASQPGHYRLEIPIRSGDVFDDVPRVLLPDPGVYPVTIELRNADGVLATTRTNLIRLPGDTSDQGEPLSVSTVLPVAAAEGITVADAEKLLATHPDLPLTVVFDEGVTPQLQADPALTAALVAAIGHRPLIATPNIDLDPSALAAINQIDLYQQVVNDTNEELRALGFNPTTDVAIVSQPLTQAGAQALLDLGVRLVIDASASPAPNGYIDVNGNRLDLVRFDEPISKVFGEPTVAVSQATEVLARLVVRSQSNPSPVVIGGAGLGPKPTRGLNVLFAALSRPGAPKPVLLDKTATSSFERRPAEHPHQDLEPLVGLIDDAEALLSSYEAMYSGGGTSPADYLLRLQSALALGRNPQDRHRALILFGDDLGRELEVLSLPDAQPVTMAARRGLIPLIVESRAAGPRLVMLRFRSDKVQVAQDSQLLVVEPGTSSIDVEVEARSLGGSQLEVSVWTPDGDRVLATSQFQIRSTAVPGLGLLISVAALIFLIVWWYIDHRRAQSKRVEAKAASIIAETPAGRANG